MRRGRSLEIAWLVALCGLWLMAAPPIHAQPAFQAPEIAVMAVHGAEVSWSPTVDCDRFVLTVSGKGYIMQREFAAGETPTFAPVDGDGFQLPDGTYKWEIKAMPRLRDLDPALFKGDETSADGRQAKAAPAARRMLQSGAFSIQNGALVNPDLLEFQMAKTPTASPVNAAAEEGVRTDADQAAPDDN